MIIEGSLVRLRPTEPGDEPLVLEWQNDPQVFWLMDYERPFTLEDVHASEERARAEGHPFIVEVDGRPIGRIGLNGFRPRDRICSLYVFIGDRSCWDRGYGTDAILALLRFAFDAFDLHIVELWSLAENERAIRAYEKCGFRLDARLRQRSYKEGTFHDRVVMSVTAEEFSDSPHPLRSGNG